MSHFTGTGDTAIVIPFKNEILEAEECLLSLKKHAPFDVFLLGINNGDEAKTQDFIMRMGGEVLYFKGLNISKMWNRGIDFCIKKGYEKFIVMNNDIIIFPQVIERIKDALDLFFCAQPIRLEGGELNLRKVAKILGKEDSYEEGGICGPCFGLSLEGVNFLKNDGFAQGKVFDESFFLWYQDSDLLHRLNLMERPPRDIQNAVIYHFLSKTLWKLPNWGEIVAKDGETYNRKWNVGQKNA